MHKSIAACLFLTIALARANDAAPYGIEKRTLWTTSHVIGSPDKAPPYRAVRTLIQTPMPSPTSPALDLAHENVRGAKYFQ